MQTRQRDSNIELLRIVGMCFIITGHWYGLSGFKNAEAFSISSLETVVTYLICYMHRMSNLLFMFITAWHLDKKIWSGVRFIRSWLQTMFYGVILGGLGYAINGGDFIKLVQCFFPITGAIYWFVSTYLIFLLFIPFFSYGINHLKIIVIKRLAVIMTVFLILIPTILPISHVFASREGGIGLNVVIFSYIYILCYLMKNVGIGFDAIKPLKIKCKLNKSTTMKWLYFALFAGNYAVIVILHFLGTLLLNGKSEKVLELSNWYWVQYNTLFAFLSMFGLFMLFKSISFKHSVIINYIGSLTFAAYLFHNNPLFSDVLWGSIKSLMCFLEINSLAIEAFLSIFVVYAAVAVIEPIRKGFEKIILRFLSPILDGFEKIYEFAND